MSYEVKAPEGRFDGKRFLFPARVYYEDTDAGGVVYYANYLKFAERARTEFVRALGFGQQAVLAEERCGFMVRGLEIEYKASAVLDDLLSISCELTDMRGARAEMKQEIRRGEELLAALTIKLVYVNFIKKAPVRLPSSLIERVERL